jgi:hypothetical protein
LIRILGGVRNSIEATENLTARSALVRRPRIRKHRRVENWDRIQGDPVTVVETDSVQVRGDKFNTRDRAHIESSSDFGNALFDDREIGTHVAILPESSPLADSTPVSACHPER